jgi:hypothetical protein
VTGPARGQPAFFVLQANRSFTMAPSSHRVRAPLRVIGLLACAALSLPAWAASSSVAAAHATYQRERAICMQARNQDRRPDCLSEASTAYAAALPPVPDVDPGRYARNALERCKALPEPDRNDCVLRMQGRGTTSGSVEGGGIYRELVTIVPGEAPAPR